MCDWQAAEHEYVTGNDGYRAIAAKYGVRVCSVNQYGKWHDWVKKRKKYKDAVSAKAVQKAAEATSDAYARAAASIAESAAILAEKMGKDIEAKHSFKSYEYKHYSGALLDLAKLLPDRRIDEQLHVGLCLIPDRTDQDD